MIRSNSGKLRISMFNSFILRLSSKRSYKRGEGDFFFSLQKQFRVTYNVVGFTRDTRFFVQCYFLVGKKEEHFGGLLSLHLVVVYTHIERLA